MNVDTAINTILEVCIGLSCIAIIISIIGIDEDIKH